jgi:preprotein translocase subunit SecG
MMMVLLVLHVLICLALVGLVLIQQGQGADAGAAFGSGSSGTVFGARGAGSFLSRMTAGLATALFLTSLVLAYMGSHSSRPTSVTDKLPPPPATAPAPGAPAPASEAPAPQQAPGK